LKSKNSYPLKEKGKRFEKYLSKITDEKDKKIVLECYSKEDPKYYQIKPNLSDKDKEDLTKIFKKISGKKKCRCSVRKICRFCCVLFKLAFCIELEEGDKEHEKIIKKRLNLFRIIIILLFPLILPLYKKVPSIISESLTDHNFLIFIVILLITHLLIVIYFGWIKKLWEFLKKDSIIHYIFLALIPIAIIVLGFRYFPGLNANNGENNDPGNQKDKNISMTKNDYDETIDRLNGFYGALFTAIAVIAALLGLGAWRSIKELKEKLEKFKEIEEKVEFLYKKKEYADWVEELIDTNPEGGLSSFSFAFSPEDEKKFGAMKKFIEEKFAQDSKLELLLTHRLLNDPHKENEEKDFKKAKCMYKWIENKNGFLNDSTELKPTLYHYMGQLYWQQYSFYREKYDFFDSENGRLKKIDKSEIGKYIGMVEKSKRCYKKSNELHEDFETQANLSVVLIELYKLKRSKDFLDEAEKFLREIEKKKPTYNTYWDLARVLFYRQQIDREDRSKEIRDYLLAVVRNIKKDKDIRFFKKRIEEESSEYNGEGFPRKVLFDEIMAKLKDC
jgi:hypothetical protein